MTDTNFNDIGVLSAVVGVTAATENKDENKISTNEKAWMAVAINVFVGSVVIVSIMLLLTYAPESSTNITNLLKAAAIATMIRPLLSPIGDMVALKFLKK